MTRLTAYGTHEGDLPGAARTGHRLEMTAIAIHRIAKGKIVEHWANKDEVGFLRQIGVLPHGDEAGSEGGPENRLDASGGTD